MTTHALYVDVECSGPLTRGMTVVDVDDITKLAPNADVALEVDSAAFNRLLIERVVALDARLR